MNMLRNTIGLSVLLFLSQSLLAQNRRIEGFVLDQNDRQPLPGAHVSIPSAALQTVTGADGSFVLEQVPEGELALEISFLGKVTHLETIAAGKTPKH